jgi:hypothetical protein
VGARLGPPERDRSMVFFTRGCGPRGAVSSSRTGGLGEHARGRSRGNAVALSALPITACLLAGGVSDVRCGPAWMAANGRCRPPEVAASIGSCSRSPSPESSGSRAHATGGFLANSFWTPRAATDGVAASQ